MDIKKTLSNIAGWFQPAYNKIEKWDCPWLREICKDIWADLPDNIRKVIYNFSVVVTDAAVTKFGAEGEKKAQELIQAMKDKYDEMMK